MKKCCLEFRKENYQNIKKRIKEAILPTIFPPGINAQNYQHPDELKNIAETFVYLQDLRHSADYDLSRQITNNQAADAIVISKTAIDDLKKLMDSHPQVARAFFGLLLHAEAARMLK